MQRIERYGVIALVFLIVTIVAVSFWGDGARATPWSSWFGANKESGTALAAAERAPRRKPDLSAEHTRRTVGPDLPVSHPDANASAAPFDLERDLAPPAQHAAQDEWGVGPRADNATGTLAQHAPEPELLVENPYASGAAGIPRAPNASATRVAKPSAASSKLAAGAASTPPLSAPKGSRRYLVRKGDSLSTIASRELGSSKRWTEIQALNGGLDPRRLAAGTEILLPPREGAPALAAAAPSVPKTEAMSAPKAEAKAQAPAAGATRTYVVGKGDTLSEIASRELGSASKWREIVEANPGVDPERLFVGARLKLPAGPASNGATVPSERPSPAVARAEPPSAPRSNRAETRDGLPRVR